MIPWAYYADYLEDRGTDTRLFRAAEPVWTIPIITSDRIYADGENCGFGEVGETDIRTPWNGGDWHGGGGGGGFLPADWGEEEDLFNVGNGRWEHHPSTNDGDGEGRGREA